MEINKIDFPHKKMFVKIFGDDVYLVGGAVRDFIISGTIDKERDIDLMVTGCDYDGLEKSLKGFGRINTVGKSFAVLKFSTGGITFDISIPRKDKKKDADSDSHRNFIIKSGKDISLEEDLGRRDFSCNSVAIRLKDGKVFDPYNGIDAIERKKIVMTGPESFSDDPLRLLRAARFSSVLGFSIEDEIYRIGKNVVLRELSEERITEELYRVLLESEFPSKGFLEYFRLTILEKLYPDIYKTALTIQDSEFHPETDEYGHHTVFAHTLIALDIAKKVARIKELTDEETLALLLGVLLHDIGKPQTTKWEYKRGRMTVTSVKHDSKGVGIAEGILDGLKIETKMKFPIKATVLKLIKFHHRIYDLYRVRDNTGFKAFSRLLRDMDGMDNLLVYLDFSDRQSRNPDPLGFNDLDSISKWYFEKKNELNISFETIKPIVLGRHLIKEGVPPGVKMGEYLERLYEFQLDGLFSSLDEGIKLFNGIKEN